MDEQIENEACGTQEAPKEASGVGMSEAEQAVPLTTLCRERLIEIIANNKLVIADAEKTLEVLNQSPQLDGSFCRLFGVQPKRTVN